MGMKDWVCGTCGVPIARTSTNSVVHVDSIPQGVEEHDAFPWVTREEFLFNSSKAQEASLSPAERQASALERIADALEVVVARIVAQPLDT